jgi:hypothetical protein
MPSFCAISPTAAYVGIRFTNAAAAARTRSLYNIDPVVITA